MALSDKELESKIFERLKSEYPGIFSEEVGVDSAISDESKKMAKWISKIAIEIVKHITQNGKVLTEPAVEGKPLEGKIT